MKKAQFEDLLASVEQMDDIVKGKKSASRVFEFSDSRVKTIREKTGLTQDRFALLIGVSKRTLENWEQGRRHPTGPAKTLLRLLDADAKRVIETLHD